jgi:hypothetical protein
MIIMKKSKILRLRIQYRTKCNEKHFPTILLQAIVIKFDLFSRFSLNFALYIYKIYGISWKKYFYRGYLALLVN